MKYKIFTVTALTGGVVAELFGEWDKALQTLLIFMVVDWITGGILLPVVFGRSPKSPNGALESRAGWKGLCRKAMILFYVLVAAQLDSLFGIDYVRDAVCIGFIANEVLSIVGNAGYNSYTKYARDVNNWRLDGCQGQPWCATYQFWLEARIFGVETALKHFCMSRNSYRAYNCFEIYDAFERKGKISRSPGIGSLIVFRHSHIGRVIDVRNGYVYTNEGNTSALYGDSNGGTVKTKKYQIGDSSIKGYCLIDYKEDNTTISEDQADTKQENLRVKEYQEWLNYWYGTLLKKHCGSILTLDGQYGSRTRKASLAVWKDVVNRLYGGKLSFDGELFDSECMNTARTIVLSFGSSGTLTAIAEGILAAEGMYLGNIDAQFGTEMKKSTKAFQMKYGLDPDGEAFFYIYPKKTLVRKMEV